MFWRIPTVSEGKIQEIGIRDELDIRLARLCSLSYNPMIRALGGVKLIAAFGIQSPISLDRKEPIWVVHKMFAKVG